MASAKRWECRKHMELCQSEKLNYFQISLHHNTYSEDYQCVVLVTGVAGTE